MAKISSITPILRYRDVRRAADWLCEAFGFSEYEVQKDSDDTINYVILNLAERFVLVAPADDAAFKALLVQPEETNWTSTQTCYVTVDNIDEHFEQAQSAGAQMDSGIESDGFGGRYYFCRDSDGHLWCFGDREYATLPLPVQLFGRHWKFHSATIGVALLCLLGGGWWILNSGQMNSVSNSKISTSQEHRLLEENRQSISDLRNKLKTERNRTDSLGTRVEKQTQDLSALKSARDKAASQNRQLAQQLDSARIALAEVERKYSELEQSSQTSRDQQQQLSAQLEGARATVGDLQNQLQRAESEQTVAQLALNQLKKDLADEQKKTEAQLKANQDNLRQMQIANERSDQQQSVISKQIEDLDSLRLARQRAEQDKNTLARELENAKASQTQTQKRLAELEKLSADLESKTKTLGAALDQSTTELSDVQKQLALTSEDKAAQTELIQKQTRDLEDLRLARTRLEEEKNTLTRDLEAAKAASETAQTRLSDLAKAGDETRKTEQELENQLQASRAQFADLQSQLARATDDRQVQNDLFRKQTQDLENLRLARKKLEDEKNALIRELETSKAASESVQSRLSELTKAASEARKTEQELENQLQATLAQLAELQSQLAQAAADKQVQNELLGKQTQDLEGLRLARTRIEQERNILARELEAAKTASESTQNRLSELTKTADKAKQNERELGTQLEASRAQLAELQSQLAQAVADKQSQDDLFGIQSKDLEDLRNALTKLEEEKSSLTRQLEAARTANEHAQARLSELANTTSDAPQKEQELEEELEKTKARLSAVQLEFDQALANRKSVEQVLSQLKNELAAEQVKANRNLENNEELLKQLKASQALISAQESRLKSLETTIAEEKRIRRQQETRVADIFQRSPASMLREENAQPIPSTEADLFNDQINLIAQTLADQQSRLIVRQQEFALLQSQLKVYEDQIIKFRTDLQETQRQLIENSDRSLTTDEVMRKLRQNLETTKFLARTATIKAENAVSAKARAEWEIRQARKLESRLRSRIRKLERQLGKGKKKYRAKPKKSSVAPKSKTPKADQKQRSHKRSWFYKNNDEKTKRYCKMCLTDH